MKLLIAFAVLLVGTNANILRAPSPVPSVPVQQYSFSELSRSAEELGKQIAQNQNDARFIEGIIADILQLIIDQIVKAELDPLEVDDLEFRYRLPVTNLLNIDAAAEDIVLAGVSNIVINRVSYSIFTNRIIVDIALPRISAAIGDSGLGVTVFGGSLNANLRGSIDIVELRVQTDVRISLSITGGISIRSVDVDVTVRDIVSNFALVIQNTDYSELLNNLLGVWIPNKISTFKSDIIELAEYIALVVIDRIQNPPEVPDTGCLRNK